MEIRKITHHDTIDFIMKKHYAQRMPSISVAFGLFIQWNLEGVLTIWKPASNSLCEWVCGKDYKDIVYELNRLIVNEWMPKNTLSQFVWWVLRQLKNDDLIIVSYSDTGMWHHGYIYTKPQTSYILASRKNEQINILQMVSTLVTTLMSTTTWERFVQQSIGMYSSQGNQKIISWRSLSTLL